MCRVPLENFGGAPTQNVSYKKRKGHRITGGKKNRGGKKSENVRTTGPRIFYDQKSSNYLRKGGDTSANFKLAVKKQDPLLPHGKREKNKNTCSERLSTRKYGGTKCRWKGIKSREDGNSGKRGGKNFCEEKGGPTTDPRHQEKRNVAGAAVVRTKNVDHGGDWEGKLSIT